jgi:hypothetical protein
MRECPRCGDLCPVTASVCECGQALQPPVTTAHVTPLAPIPSCSCGDLGICTVCVLASYEPVEAR